MCLALRLALGYTVRNFILLQHPNEIGDFLPCIRLKKKEKKGGTSLVPSGLKNNLPANAGDVGSIPGSEDPLEKEMATHSSILAWKIPWTEESGGLHTVHWVTKESDST